MRKTHSVECRQDGGVVNSRLNKADRMASLNAFRTYIVVLVFVVTVAFALVQGPVAHSESAAMPRFKAIAFDYLVLFNPDSVVPEVEQVFPGRGREFTNLWRTRQFEYSWLRSITGRYVDFFEITEEALIYTAAAMNLELSPENKHRL